MNAMATSMQSDLSALFAHEMQVNCTIGAVTYTVLLDDAVNDELEGYGGPEAVQIQRVHFQTTDLKSIEIGTTLQVLGKNKIVISSITSADGNELIVTVRGD